MKNTSPYSKRSLKRLADYPDVLTVEEASELLGVCIPHSLHAKSGR